MALTTQELYLTLYAAALGGLGDSVGRTTTPITADEAADFAGDMASAGMLWLFNAGVTSTYIAIATSPEAGQTPIPPSTVVTNSTFSPDIT